MKHVAGKLIAFGVCAGLLTLGYRADASPSEDKALDEAIVYAEFRAQVADQMARNAKMNLAELTKIYSSTKVVAFSSTMLVGIGLGFAVIPAAQGTGIIRTIAGVGLRIVSRLGRRHPITTLVATLVLTGARELGGIVGAGVPIAGLIALPIVIIDEKYVGKSWFGKSWSRTNISLPLPRITTVDLKGQVQNIARDFGKAHVQVSRYLDQVLNSIPDSSFPFGWPDYKYAQAMVSAEKTQQNLWEAEAEFMQKAAVEMNKLRSRLDEESRAAGQPLMY